MQKHVLFIQGAGEDGYIEDGKLAASLQQQLGAEYNLVYPPMPNADHPEHDAWKDRIAQELAALKGSIFLVGHSLGGSTLVKYLAENKLEVPLSGVFLVAAPFWNAEDPDVAEYALADDFAVHLPAALPLYFYHSRDDEWVPFEQLAKYAAHLPQATIREFDGRGHQFNDDLSEVAADIDAL